MTEKAYTGFKAMDPEAQRKVASQGGKIAHKFGLAHIFSSEEAKQAGRLGGAVVAAGRLDDLLASSTILVRSPDATALAAALHAEGIDFVAGPGEAFTVDTGAGRVTAELLASVALTHQVLLTELRQSETTGLEQLFFSLTTDASTNENHPTQHASNQEAAA